VDPGSLRIEIRDAGGTSVPGFGLQGYPLMVGDVTGGQSRSSQNTMTDINSFYANEIAPVLPPAVLDFHTHSGRTIRTRVRWPGVQCGCAL